MSSMLSRREDFSNSVFRFAVGTKISRNAFLHRLVEILYSRTTTDFRRGTFRVKRDTVDIYPAYMDLAYRISFFGDDIEELSTIDPATGKSIEKMSHMAIFPANLFVTPKERLTQSIWSIQEELEVRKQQFIDQKRFLEAKRLEERVNYDLEMIRELGYCSGIENYSRFFDGRTPGMRPFCLLDYFPDDYLMIIDESHVTVPQIRAMYGGDRSRKLSWVACYSNELIALAGGINVFGDRPGASVEVTPEDVVRGDPELCFVSWCGVAEAKLDPDNLIRRPGLEALAAARAGRVYRLDERFSGRPGPRMLTAARIMARAIAELA